MVRRSTALSRVATRAVLAAVEKKRTVSLVALLRCPFALHFAFAVLGLARCRARAVQLALIAARHLKGGGEDSLPEREGPAKGGKNAFSNKREVTCIT
jgi:hypothetical protein